MVTSLQITLIGRVFVLQCQEFQGNNCKLLVCVWALVWVCMVNSMVLLYFTCSCCTICCWFLFLSAYIHFQWNRNGIPNESLYPCCALPCVSAGESERGASPKSQAEVHVRLRCHCRWKTPDSGGSSSLLPKIKPPLSIDISTDGQITR